MNFSGLEKLAKAATSGPWETNPADVLSEELEVTASNHFVSICDAAPYDALYIAAANPQTILAMIEVIKEMAEALEWQQGGDLRKAALAKYKEMTK